MLNSTEVRLPTLHLHVSPAFQKYFVVGERAYRPQHLRDLVDKAQAFVQLLEGVKEGVLGLIPEKTGVPWDMDVIDIWLFLPINNEPLPCISDPMMIRLDASLHVALAFLIHELVHLNTSKHPFYRELDEERSEFVAYFVTVAILRDIVDEEAEGLIDTITTKWPYDYVQLRRRYSERVRLSHRNMMQCIIEVFGGEKHG